MQTKKHSFLEVCLGTFIGFFVAMGAQMIVLPWFDVDITPGVNFAIALIFTVISIVRGYFVRRFFNYLHSAGIL